MVLPAAAAVASRVGPAIRSTGGAWMHSSKEGFRKMGSKMLRSSDKKIEDGINNIYKKVDTGTKFISTISKGVGKIVGSLSKHSPALKQQLIILGKSISVILRPIGDIMAKFLRPMAIWMMKFAQKWYSIFGTGGGDNKLSKEDAIQNAEKQLEALKAGGAPAEQIQMAQQNLDNLKKDQGPDTKNPLEALWKKLIPESFKETLSALGDVFKEVWAVVKELAKIFWDVFGPGIKFLAGLIGGVLVVVLKNLTFLFEGIAFVLKLLAEGLRVVRIVIETVWSWIKKLITESFEKFIENIKLAWDVMKGIGAFVKDIFVVSWNLLKESVSAVYDWVKNTFISIWDNLLTAMKNMWDGVKKIIDKIKFWKKNDEESTDSKAVGGFIPETGIYKLHAGERVMTAGETSRTSNNSNSMNVTNVFQISATLNNDIDIETLADKLSQYQETELRRRVSYF